MSREKISRGERREITRVQAIVGCYVEMVGMVANELVERAAPLDRRLSSAEFIALALQNIIAYAAKNEDTEDPEQLVNKIIFDRIIH